jgi:hypothetical protein
MRNINIALLAAITFLLGCGQGTNSSPAGGPPSTVFQNGDPNAPLPPNPDGHYGDGHHHRPLPPPQPVQELCNGAFLVTAQGLQTRISIEEQPNGSVFGRALVNGASASIDGVCEGDRVNLVVRLGRGITLVGRVYMAGNRIYMQGNGWTAIQN